METFERISTYELSQALKAIQGICERLPKAISLELDETANCAIEDTISKINRTMEVCKQFEATLDARQNELCKQIDAAYAKVRDARESMRKRLTELPMFELPFGRGDLEKIDAFCDTAKQLGSLSDLSWTRMLQLAKAFANEVDKTDAT